MHSRSAVYKFFVLFLVPCMVLFASNDLIGNRLLAQPQSSPGDLLPWARSAGLSPPIREVLPPLQNPQAIGPAGRGIAEVNGGRAMMVNELKLTGNSGFGSQVDNFGLGRDGLLPAERNSIAVYEKSNRSTVHISTSSIELDAFLQVSMRGGGGSGSVLDREGRILTNQHVIDGAREISVRLANGSSYPATVVGQDVPTDIAVLQINAPQEQLVPIEWNTEANLRVGQRIYAIGNPFGLERTMSAGMISSLNRQFSDEGRIMRSLIQIDASINQGNSGGPLLNTRGQLIGMNTAIMSSDGDSAGVGFAIPVSTLTRIVPQLVQGGKAVRASIGIRRVYETDRGLLVVATLEGGPADVAGLNGFGVVQKTFTRGSYTYQQQALDTSQADLILSVNGQPVRTADEMLAIIEGMHPGDEVEVVIVRDGQQMRVPVVLGQSQ